MYDVIVSCSVRDVCTSSCRWASILGLAPCCIAAAAGALAYTGVCTMRAYICGRLDTAEIQALACKCAAVVAADAAVLCDGMLPTSDICCCCCYRLVPAGAAAAGAHRAAVMQRRPHCRAVAPCVLVHMTSSAAAFYNATDALWLVMSLLPDHAHHRSSV